MTGTSLIATMASRYSMDPVQFARTVRATAMPSGKTTDEQFAAFMMVAHEYNLNPITREIFAFPGRNGGITPVVSIDGWIHLVNAHPQADGFDIAYGHDKDGKLVSATCQMWRKDRSHPIVVTEWLDEVYRNTDAWNGMPRRMLRHKAFKECARLAFGFAGITDEDEARDMRVVEPVTNQRITIDSDAKNTLDAFASGALDPDTTAAPSAGSVETAAPDIAAQTPSGAAVDPFDTYQAGDQRPAIIDALFRIATDKRAVQDRLEGLDVNHTDLIDLHPALEPFIKDVTTTAVKVAKGELSAIAGRKYVEAML
jgi:phage recombination protein Bet